MPATVSRRAPLRVACQPLACQSAMNEARGLLPLLHSSLGTKSVTLASELRRSSLGRQHRLGTKHVGFGYHRT